MLSECLGDASMRQGVPFIAPRQLGAVERIFYVIRNLLRISYYKKIPIWQDYTAAEG